MQRASLAIIVVLVADTAGDLPTAASATNFFDVPISDVATESVKNRESNRKFDSHDRLTMPLPPKGSQWNGFFVDLLPVGQLPLEL